MATKPSTRPRKPRALCAVCEIHAPEDTRWICALCDEAVTRLEHKIGLPNAYPVLWWAHQRRTRVKAWSKAARKKLHAQAPARKAKR